MGDITHSGAFLLAIIPTYRGMYISELPLMISNRLRLRANSNPPPPSHGHIQKVYSELTVQNLNNFEPKSPGLFTSLKPPFVKQVAFDQSDNVTQS